MGEAQGIGRRSLLKGGLVGLGVLGLPGAASAARAAGAAAARSAAGVAPAGSAGPALLQLARVWPGGGDLAGFDDTHVVFEDGSVEVLLWPGDLARLQASGMRHEITVTDVAARDAAAASTASTRPAPDVLPPQPGERSDYRRFADFEADMRALVAAHPTKARLVTLPEKSLEGRTVYGIEIARDVARKDGRPVFYQDGCHHAREWPAAEMCIMWAFDLLEKDGKDARITALLTNARHVVVPVVNPDGFTLSRESPVQVSNLGTVPPGGLEGYWRKNRRSFSGLLYPAGNVDPHLNADAHGIDNNRNYGYRWGGDGSSSSNTVQNSRGPAPFSEPETRNVAWALGRWQCTAANTNHTAGNLILRAWGDTFDAPPDDALLKSLGDAMGKITGYRSQKSIQLYVTTGTCSDFMYGAFGSLGYTFEHSGSGFHPPYAATVPAMYAKVRPAFLLLAEAAANPKWHGVIRGRLTDASGTGVAGAVKVRKPLALPLTPGNPTGAATVPFAVDNVEVETAADGSFELHVNPSTMPYLTFLGETQPYELELRAGTATSRVDVVVDRGEDVDLGDVRVPPS